MQELYDLKDTLCKELKKYGQKNDISNATLDVVDKLAHTIKNLDKIIDGMEGGSYGMNGYHMNYSGDSSYARGRGMNARRDSMGRYSREGYSRDHEMVAELKNLMHDAPDESIRQDIQRIISKVENM